MLATAEVTFIGHSKSLLRALFDSSHMIFYSLCNHVSILYLLFLLSVNFIVFTYHLITVPVFTLTIYHLLSLSLKTYNPSVPQFFLPYSLSGSTWTASTEL